MSETLPTSVPPRWMNYLALALLLLTLAWLIMRPPTLEPVQRRAGHREVSSRRPPDLA